MMPASTQQPSSRPLRELHPAEARCCEPVCDGTVVEASWWRMGRQQQAAEGARRHNTTTRCSAACVCSCGCVLQANLRVAVWWCCTQHARPHPSATHVTAPLADTSRAPATPCHPQPPPAPPTSHALDDGPLCTRFAATQSAVTRGAHPRHQRRHATPGGGDASELTAARSDQRWQAAVVP
jgi:hypothetical protein